MTRAEELVQRVVKEFEARGYTVILKSNSDYQVLKDDDISDAQLYKMAGNSIVVNVLNNIFKAFVIQYPEYLRLKLRMRKRILKDKSQLTILFKEA